MKSKLVYAVPVTLSLLPAHWALAQAAASGQEPTKTGAPVQQQTPPPATGQTAPPAKGNVPATATTPGATGKGKPQGKPGGKKTTAPKPPAPPKPAWDQFKLNPKTTIFLDFTDANIDMIISIFSRTSGITIIKDPSFKQPLTVTSAKAVKLDEAFDIFNTVLGLYNYEFRKQGNLLMIGRKQPPQQPMMQAPPPPPQPEIKTYVLEFANAAQVAKVVNEVFGAAGGNSGGGNPGFPPGMIINGMPMGMPGGGGPQGGNQVKATSEDYSNSVIVKAMPADQAKVEALIKSIDKKTTQPLSTELFQLKHVPAEQVLSAVQDLLQSNTPMGRGASKKDDNNRFSDYYFYSPFGNNNSRNSAGGQSATAIKQTNSITVTATPENIELVRKLLQTLDQPGVYVGTTNVIPLKNAKASDVADLLTKLLAQQRNNDDNPFGFFISDFYGGGDNNSRNKNQSTDLDENGNVVNVRDILGKVNIQADPNTNSLLIVTQPGNMKMIREMVEQLDAKAGQVVIETVIVEANLDRDLKLGVEWNLLSSKLFSNTFGSGSIKYGLESANPSLQGLNYTITGEKYRAFLNMMNTDTRFKVLDTPRIFTSNNTKAEIKVGQRLPYITNQTVNALGNVVSSYNFEDVAVTLTVTPRITSNGQVTMDVVQSADDLAGFTDYNAPIINNRKATTTVSVTDGETVVLGGIIRHTSNITDKKVPLLGDIPLLGNLFRSTSKSTGQTELMVFLTPHIVRSNEDAQQIREQQTKEMTKGSQDSLKKLIPPANNGN